MGINMQLKYGKLTALYSDIERIVSDSWLYGFNYSNNQSGKKSKTRAEALNKFHETVKFSINSDLKRRSMADITDTERLDFMIENSVRILSTGEGIKKLYHFPLGPKVFTGDTPREAIEAAIKAQKEQKQ